MFARANKRNSATHLCMCMSRSSSNSSAVAPLRPLAGLLGRNIAAQAAELARSALQTLPTNRTPPVIDIDIGTAGIPIASRHYLVTFDPFDLPILHDNHERLAVAISPHVESHVTFFVNVDKPGCSSMLPVNPAFRHNDTLYLADCLPEDGCRLAPECTRCKTCHTLKHRNDRFFHGAVLPCRRPQGGFEVRTVPAQRLSNFLRERRVERVEFLKIDAQGADRAIVEDVFARTELPVRHLRVECQLLDGRVPPAYVDKRVPPNDCHAIIALVRRLRPALARVEWAESNCHVAEYNLDFYESTA